MDREEQHRGRDRELEPLTAHDNESWLRYLTPSKLINTDFLYGTRVSDSTSGVEVEVRTASGELRSMNVDATDQGVPLIPVYQGDLPLYRSHPEKVYWSAVIDHGTTVYFQYNSCREDPAQASTEFFADLDRLMTRPEVQRVIVDLRNNTGGTTAPMSGGSSGSKRADSTGRARCT